METVDMTDLKTALNALRRPRLLIRAARFGLTDYNRDRDLRRLIRSDKTPSPVTALGWLMEEEARIEESRKTEIAGYSPGRHIDVLVAIMAESRLLPERRDHSPV